MESSVLKRILPALFTVALLSEAFSSLLAAGLTIERVQRDFQARYNLVRGNYVEWPKCSANETPAPRFPKDGFYGEILEDPDKGVELVADLATKFHQTHVIYTEFVAAPNGYTDLQNVPAIDPYTQMLPVLDPSAVTSANYMEKLQELYSQVQKLRLIKVPATQLVGLDDRRIVFAIDWDTCEDAKQCLEQVVGSAWGRSKTYLNCELLSDQHVSALGLIRVNNSFFGNGQIQVENVKGRIWADLRAYSKGTVKVFLKLGMLPSEQGEGDVFGAPRPTSADLDRFGVWECGVLKLGSYEETTGFVTYSDSLPPTDCSRPPGSATWQVSEAVAIVSPDFTTTPDPQDCCPCTECEPGAMTAALQSIDVNIGLGTDNYGGSAGALTLSADSPSWALATIGALRYSFANGVEKIPTGNPTVRLQFKTSQALTDIQKNTDYKYTISIYQNANVGAKDADGFYQTTGPASRTIAVENPDTTTYNRLRATDTKDGNASVSDYVYTPSTDEWELTTGAGLRKATRASVWDTTQTLRTETVTTKNDATPSQIVYREENKYQRFPWGQERIQQIVDPDAQGYVGAKLTSSWEFYSDPAVVGSYGHLKKEVNANGHWIKYEYDGFGRETKRVIQFHDELDTSTENANRVVTTIYSPNDPQITIEERLLENLVTRRYQVVHSGEVRDIVAQTPGALWNDPNNVVTITKRRTSDPFKGELASVENPDGTMQIYSYAIDSVAGTRTDTVDSGQPNPQKTAIIDGTRTVTVRGAVGQMISRTVTDIAANPAITLAGETYSNPDEFKRPRRVTYLDGTYADTDYGCCGVVSTTDRDGVVTTYLYDNLRRQDGEIRLGTTTRNTLDPDGRVLVTKRIGTDNSEITVHQAAYDLAGRLTSETNALNGRTTYSESFNLSGQLLKTIIYPNSGQRIERYHKDGSLAEVSGTAAFPTRFEYGVDAGGAFTKEIKVATGGGVDEWTRSYTDFAGRPYKTIYAHATEAPFSQSFYNSKGQLWKQRDPDDVITLFKYNAKGEQEYSIVALTLTAHGLADYAALEAQLSSLLAGNDRITRTISDVAPNASLNPSPPIPVRRVRTYAHAEGSSTQVAVSMTETSTDGLRTWQTAYRDAATPVVAQSLTEYNKNDGPTAAGYRTVTVTDPALSKTVTVYNQGRLYCVAHKSSANGQITKTTYAYDAHGRLWTATDARNGATTFIYNNADQVVTKTTPAPGTGQPPQVTRLYNDPMGQATNIVQPDGASVTNAFTKRGELAGVWGSRTYPVGYEYDSQGRLRHMTNWGTFSTLASPRITQWNYNPERGWLDNKRYPDKDTGLPSALGPAYGYSLAGRLTTRTWARGLTTTYSYNVTGANWAGDLKTVVYSDDTPDLIYTYDRRGRLKTITQTAPGPTERVTTLTYNGANQPTGESTQLNSISQPGVSIGYDSLLRRNQLDVVGANQPVTAGYSYDAASRLDTVTFGGVSATYSYVVNSPLIGQTVYKQGAAMRMTTAKQYDKLNRLTAIGSARPAGGPPVGNGVPPLPAFGYLYNDANQRVQVTMADGSYWYYEYDRLGQIKAARKYWADGTFVAGQQFEYGFDDIGNRLTTKTGSDENGANPRQAGYTPNRLNQYASRTVPGGVDILGVARADASVSVNSQAPYRHGEYYRREVPVNNGTPANPVPAYASVTVNATLGASSDSRTGHHYVPPATEAYQHDDDGNLTSDGRWDYTWDGENRLIAVQTRAGALSAGVPYRRLEFDSDWRGRRVSKRVWTMAGGAAAVQLRFVYDGWNLLAEVDGANNVARSYAWGLDLSGTLEGAGGVGGLLAINVAGSGVQVATYDGNGNVAGLLQASDGAVTASYEYGPFGELIRSSGPLAEVSPFRFSTKYQDEETDLLYYGFRYYDPCTGRWLGRDPFGERGGLLLYGFISNNPINATDFLGLDTIWHHEYVQEFRDFFSKLDINIDHDSCGIFITEENHQLVHNTFRYDGKTYNEYWKTLKSEVETALSKGKMTQAEAKKAVEDALEKLRRHPKYALIRHTGAAIPKGLTYDIYKEMKAEEKAALFAKVWQASKLGAKLKYLGAKTAEVGGKVIRLASIAMIPSQYKEGSAYAANVYHGGTFMQAAAGTGQAVLPLGPADSSATWDMSQHEVAAGNQGWGPMFETLFNPTSPRWFPTQIYHGIGDTLFGK